MGFDLRWQLMNKLAAVDYLIFAFKSFILGSFLLKRFLTSIPSSYNP
jgi:hypothetical protein